MHTTLYRSTIAAAVAAAIVITTGCAATPPAPQLCRVIERMHLVATEDGRLRIISDEPARLECKPVVLPSN